MANTNGVRFPKKGLSREQLLQQMKDEKIADLKWRDGRSFCLIYYPGEERAQMVQDAYNLFFTENALNPMSFPSLRKYEAEVVAMVADLLNGDDETTGTMTSGGTESILMAVKTARDFSKKNRPEINKPEIIIPVTAHPAFDKACHYFKVKPVFVKVENDFRVNVKEVEEKITKNTIMIVGSAPSYPHGVMDPIEELSRVAVHYHLLFHVDSCIGGLILPFIKKLGYSIPSFDFTLEGVTSISADLHKYGYAAKGASVILYKDAELRRHQFFVATEWPGGIYGSSSIAGSRPGGAIAAAWAALRGIGEDGYLEMAKATMEATQKIREGIEAIPELRLMGSPQMSILSFDSDVINIYELADELNILGWHFERLQNPAGLHLTINYIHKDIAEKFLTDLKDTVVRVKKFKIKNFGNAIKVAAIKRLVKILPEGTIAKLQAQFSGKSSINAVRTAPLYGMMGALSGSEDLDQIVLDFLDKLNNLEK